MIASDGGHIQWHEPIRRLARVESARENIAEVHDRINTAQTNIRQHGVQSGEVTVDVGHGGDFHGKIVGAPIEKRKFVRVRLHHTSLRAAPRLLDVTPCANG